MGRQRRHRGKPIHGIVVLDKPLGMSSNAALQSVKNRLHAAKAGHTGSLDPLATGVLPLCFGEATKLSSYLLDSDKRYLATAALGRATSTGDAEGDVINTLPVPPLTNECVTTALQAFIGEIEQIPPMHSAIKYQGQPLYKLARKGIEIERQPRKIHIYTLDLIDIQDNELILDIRCSRGTYIRTLVEDIAEKLGTCGYLSALRRIQVGNFTEDMALSMQQLTELAEQGEQSLMSALLPPETAVSEWPQLQLSDDTAFYLRQGQAVFVPNAPSSGQVCLFGADAKFIGLGAIQDDGKVAPKRLFNLI